jgi:hypothetical protein
MDKAEISKDDLKVIAEYVGYELRETDFGLTFWWPDPACSIGMLFRPHKSLDQVDLIEKRLKEKDETKWRSYRQAICSSTNCETECITEAHYCPMLFLSPLTRTKAILEAVK